MGTFGDKLRREREMRGISLDEIATATKIGTRSLKALENEDFSKLPGGIFNKGFVRAYAKFLGINEDQAVADYVTAAGEAEQNSENVIEQLAAESERRENEKRIERAREKNAEPLFTWNTIAIAVLLVVAGVLGWQYYSRHKALRAEQQTAPSQPTRIPQPTQASPAVTPSVSSATPAGAAVSVPANSVDAASSTTAPPMTAQLPATSVKPTVNTPAGTPPARSTSPGNAATPISTPNAPAQEFVVVVKTTKESWVSSLADDKPQPGRLLAPNSEATFRARTHLQLNIGNAGGVEISFNGNPLPAVGKEGEVKTLVFTPEGPRQ